MEWIKLRSDGKGGHNAFNWNMGDVGMDSAVRILGFLALGAIFGMIMPALFLLFFPISNRQDRVSGIIVTILITIYLFVDYSQGWIIDYAFNQGGDANLMVAQMWLLKFNLALAFLNVVMFALYGVVERMEGGLFFLFVIGTTYLFWFPLASLFIKLL